ncbi:unnamed protein product, partial [Protopolystoma xenopodis]
NGDTKPSNEGTLNLVSPIGSTGLSLVTTQSSGGGCGSISSDKRARPSSEEVCLPIASTGSTIALTDIAALDTDPLIAGVDSSKSAVSEANRDGLETNSNSGGPGTNGVGGEFEKRRSVRPEFEPLV